MSTWDLLNKHKFRAFNLILLLVFLLIALRIYNVASKERGSLKGKKEEEIKRNQVLKEIRDSEISLGAYKRLSGQQDASLFLSKLNNLAKDSSVNLISIRPQGENEGPVYSKYSFSLNLTVKDYHQLAKFVSKIENALELFVMDSIVFTASPQAKEGGDNLKAELWVSAIFFKGREK